MEGLKFLGFVNRVQATCLEDRLRFISYKLVRIKETLER